MHVVSSHSHVNNYDKIKATCRPQFEAGIFPSLGLAVAAPG